MKLGRFTIEQLSEGRFEIFADGTINREPVDQKESDSGRPRESGKDSARIGINPILVSDGTHHILLDTGLGWGLDAGSAYRNVSNIVSNLDIFNLKPRDITHVILTHLHYDHSAGCSYTDQETVTRATFPNASYYVQKSEWKFALQQQYNEYKQQGCGYHLDDLYRLAADNRFVFIEDENVEVLNGIKLLWTGGHTPGHQAIRIEDEGKSAYYLGDLLPNEHHLNRYSMRKMDIDPLQAKKMKIQLLRRAFEERSALLFYHSLYSTAGKLERDKKKNYILKEIK